MAINFLYQRVNIRVSKMGQRIYFRTESQYGFRWIKGIYLDIGYEGALFGSTFGFRIDEKEILDESQEAYRICFSDDISPNHKMMFFEKPIAIQSSKIEGIYTDSALQGLLNNVSTHPSGGVIPKADISISKTYVSGKDLMSFNAFAVDAGIAAFSSSGAISTISTPTAATPMLNYPYDVRIELLLTQ